MKILQIIIIVLLTTSNILFAQNDTLVLRFFKIYSNANYSEFVSKDYYNSLPSHNSFSSDNADFTYGFLSLSFEKYLKNGNSHEFELLPISINHKKYINTNYDSITGFAYCTEGVKMTTFETSLRYQFNYNLNKNRNRIFYPYLGLSPNLFYLYKKTVPEVNKFYGTKLNQLGLGLSIIPSISYKLSNNIFLELNIPIRFFEFIYEYKKTENPPSPKNPKKEQTSFKDWFPVKYYLRLGMTIKI